MDILRTSSDINLLVAMRYYQILLLSCFFLIATSFSSKMNVATNLFKLKQCITLDLAKQIAAAAAREATANNWSVVCCILDDGGNVVYLVRHRVAHTVVDRISLRIHPMAVKLPITSHVIFFLLHPTCGPELIITVLKTISHNVLLIEILKFILCK